VNIGSFTGPLLAGLVRRYLTVDKMFIVASVSVLVMFFAVLIFFKEPRREVGQEVQSLGQVARNFGTVIGNWRFMLFLAIFSGYWVVFWQQYIILPIYIHDYVNANVATELTLIADPLIVICFTVLFSVLTQKIRAFTAVILGALITSIAWLVVIVIPSSSLMFRLFGFDFWGGAIIALIILAIGEITQSPRYYEYISRLAPPGQQGTYMGFAFVPIGIGSLIAGPFAGYLLHHFGEERHQPTMIWMVVTGVGLATTLLLWIYDKAFKPADSPAGAESAKA
jgi:proton-dependent oligopeptide transporter, POT family